MNIELKIKLVITSCLLLTVIANGDAKDLLSKGPPLEEVLKNAKQEIISITKIEAEVFDTESEPIEFIPDEIDYSVDASKQYVCITSIGTNFLESDELTCKQRKEIIVGLGSAVYILRGISLACKGFPHVGAKVSAQVMDVSGWVAGTIGFYYASQDCKDDKETRKKSLKEACLELRAAGIKCAAVGW